LAEWKKKVNKGRSGERNEEKEKSMNEKEGRS
jgi:hypothetical protein